MSSFDSYSTIKTLFVVGTTTSAICSGPSDYISLPSLLTQITGGLLFTSYIHVPGYVKNSSDESLLRQWQTMGAIGKAVVPPLTLIASGAHFLNSYMTHTQPQHYRFMTAGVLSLAILPYTFIALGPTNAELASREEKKENSPDYGLSNLDVKELIDRWSTRSAVRGFLLLASTIVSYDAMLHLTF